MHSFHISKGMLKIFQTRLQQYVNQKLHLNQIYKLDLEKAEESEIKLSAYIGSQKKQGNSRKTSTSVSLTMLKPLMGWITTNCGKFFKRREYQTILPASWEICMQVKKQQLALDMEQQTGSKLWKEYVKAVYCHPAYLTYMQSSVLFSCSVMSSSLPPHGLQHARLPCPSPTSTACSNSCALSQWCHPTSSSSVVPFSSCFQSFLASGFFQWVSSSHQVAKVLEFQLQHQFFQWIFWWIFSIDFL